MSDNFEISIGGKDNVNGEKEVNDFNLNNCKWRSDWREYEIKACCMQAAQRKEGYICNLLGTLGVTANICEVCPKFKQKENIIKNE